MIICEQLNPHSCKTYLIKIDGGKEVALIDPVIDHLKDYQRMINQNDYSLSLIIDTHSHADHISGGPSLADIFGCQYGMHENSPIKCKTIALKGGESLKVLPDLSVRILHTPGHTSDSISLVFPDWIFTGDALFLDEGGAGRDDLPGGNPNEHWYSLNKLWNLPDHLLVYPAHDYQNRTPTKLGIQKERNPHLLKSRDGMEQFVSYIEELKLGPADWMKDVLKANYICARDPHAAWIPADSAACEVKGTMQIGANEIQVNAIDPVALKKKLKSKNPPVLIDVRDTEELIGPLGQIKGVINIPIIELSGRLKELKSFSESEIITICKFGGRAMTAAQILTLAGFKKITMLTGGMMEWGE